MESPVKANPEMPRSDSTNSNQLFIAETLDLPDDTFRMSLNCLTEIGENVTIGDTPNDGVKNEANNTPPNTPITAKSPVLEPKSFKIESPSIIDTPKLLDDKETCKNVNLLKQTLFKKENDCFVKPSPVAEVMSPAKMLQFEIDIRNSATPTMKRAAIDFNFFNENTFEEYFKDDNTSNEKETGVSFKETPVIVKANTIRHEIAYGHVYIIPTYRWRQMFWRDCSIHYMARFE